MEKILELIKGEVCMGTYGLVELELRKLAVGQKPTTNKPMPFASQIFGNEIKVFSSDYLPDDTVIVSKRTWEKIRGKDIIVPKTSA